MAKRRVSMKVVPGDPTDGTGRVCIHFFVEDVVGPFTEPHVLHPVFKDGVVVKQRLEARPTRGRLACDPDKTVKPTTRDGIVSITSRTNEPRAVTCPKCIATKEYQMAMDAITAITG